MIFKFFAYIALALIAFITLLKQVPKRFVLWYFGGSVYWSVRDGKLHMSTIPKNDELCIHEYWWDGESRYNFCRGWAFGVDPVEMRVQQLKVHDHVLVLNVATRVGTHQKGSAVLNAGAGGLCDLTKATCFELASLIDAFLGLRQGTILPHVSVMFDDFSTAEFTGGDAVIVVK